MKIVELAPFEEPVPPLKYGGTELIVHNVTEELVRRGHEVYLFATGGSKTSANLVKVLPKPLREMYSAESIDVWRNYWKFAKLPFILEEIRYLRPDIIHNNMNWRMVPYSRIIDIPMISTIHGPLTSFNERQTYGDYKEANYISISNNQRKAMPELNWVETVYNGIDVDAFERGEGDRGYFAFLGRTSPEKGLAEICRMIKHTKHKLKIAAKVDSVDAAYFEKEVKPYIDQDQIEFLGELDHSGKNELLKNAKGLLLWLNWEEPFGLVVVEAMASGTPVIVNRRGSMPELIIDGKTGFLVDSLTEMRIKLDRIQECDRNYCREHIKKNFSKEKMADDYIRVMESIIERA